MKEEIKDKKYIDFLFNTDAEKLRYELAINMVAKLDVLNGTIKSIKDKKITVEELQAGGFDFKKYVINNFPDNYYNPKKVTKSIENFKQVNKNGK
jgi:hypothetical protein